MSALKHGFFRAGFMLCDRCAMNGVCRWFRPRGECRRERRAYDWLVQELMGQYGLEGVADQILVHRAAMYLIRIARVEAYESVVGASEKSVLWGTYICRLDNSLRRLLNDLAVTRLQRKRLRRDEELLVDVETLLKSLSGREKERRVARRFEKPKNRGVFWISPRLLYELILVEWRWETMRGDRGSCVEGDSA